MKQQKRQVYTDKAAPPQGPYSQAVVHGDLVFVAGQGPFRHSDGAITGDTIEEQTQLALDNLRAILEASGSSMADVIRIGAYIASFDLFDGYNKVFAEAFPEPRPARTTIAGDLGGILVEIDCVAAVRDA
jgi:2-iminobutanoate/2-iminopropanoate deaminase